MAHKNCNVVGGRVQFFEFKKYSDMNYVWPAVFSGSTLRRGVLKRALCVVRPPPNVPKGLSHNIINII